MRKLTPPTTAMLKAKHFPPLSLRGRASDRGNLSLGLSLGSLPTKMAFTWPCFEIAAVAQLPRNDRVGECLAVGRSLGKVPIRFAALFAILSCFFVNLGNSSAADPIAPSPESIKAITARQLPSLLTLYKSIHQQPELSLQEQKTAEKIAREFVASGLEVQSNVGGFGVVGVLRNGPGPTVLIRTELDALPVKEQTGADYASSATATDSQGKSVPVMHACGHDIHMASIVGTIRVLSALKSQWSGTIVAIAQPAEELGSGAKAMLDDGLFKRFPRPDFALAHHVDPLLALGKVAVSSGYITANVDSVDITIKGVPGHGAYPHQTKDPIVIASQLVLALQTIVSREVKPIEPAVITVGSFHAGSKHNIIPPEAKLQLTVRSYSDEVHQQLLAAIERTAKGIAIAAGLPPELSPEVSTVKNERTPSGYNNPALAARARKVWGNYFAKGDISESEPSMGGEDFAYYSRQEPSIPALFFRVGSISKSRLAKMDNLPSLHSDRYLPEPEQSLNTAVISMSALALDILKINN